MKISNKELERSALVDETYAQVEHVKREVFDLIRRGYDAALMGDSPEAKHYQEGVRYLMRGIRTIESALEIE